MTAVAVGARDGELLRALHDEHAAALWSYVTGLLHGDRLRAQDVVQETLLRAWRNPDAIADPSTSRSWLYTVAKRIVIDDWRAARRRPEVVTDEVPEIAVADATEQAIDRQLVLAAVRRLSREHREVLLECYFRGRSVAEAARTLGVPEGTIKSRTHYALHAMRAAINEMGGPA
jgi:RNA polymerase sigma-70 factor (ECF subfamily)